MSIQVPFSPSTHTRAGQACCGQAVATLPGPAEARHLDGPTARTALLAFLWCAFLLLACAMASRFDERRLTGLPEAPLQAPAAAPFTAPPVVALSGLTAMQGTMVAANGATE